MHWIDPIQLPLIKGIIERFIVNGQGEFDGLVLDTGNGAIKLVHFPSHMSDDIAAAFRRGDPVGIRGLKPRDAEIIAAVALECADGTEIADPGPPKHTNSRGIRPKQVPMSASGKIRLTLFTPKGKVRGALLDNGTILRLALKQAEQIKERLQPGATIEVRGAGLETQHGRVIDVHHVATLAGRFDVVVVKSRESPAR
jgi:hypothetical protein